MKNNVLFETRFIVHHFLCNKSHSFAVFNEKTKKLNGKIINLLITTFKPTENNEQMTTQLKQKMNDNNKIIITVKKKKSTQPTTTFVNQVFCVDLLTNMLNNTHMTGKQLFNHVMNENIHYVDERRQGWLFETLFKILVLTKCMKDVNYDDFCEGQLQCLHPVRNTRSLLCVNIEGGGNNIVDVALKHGSTFILFSIKYRNKFGETDVSKIDNTVINQNIFGNNYKIALVVKNKELVINHTYKNKMNIDKQIHDKIINDNLLFDENDVVNALSVFCNRFRGNKHDVNDFMEFIDSDYLFSPRQQLTMKLHQKMTSTKFEQSLITKKHNVWCVSHKPRSGKSITLLSMCKTLLNKGYKKILIMTSVPATINSFVDDLDKYIDFKGVRYVLQENIGDVGEDFKGIVFCSVQFLKINGTVNKKELLNRLNFDVVIADESHQGSSTQKTKNDILDAGNCACEIDEIRKHAKITIFASGTADKTKKYYNINSSCVYEWELEDEAFMKELLKPNVENREEIVECMVRRHGRIFKDCLNDSTLNQNYNKHPTQLLMKHTIPNHLIVQIKNYNDTHGTNYGYNCSSMFALTPTKTEKKNKNSEVNVEYTFLEEFEICKNNDGKELLEKFLDNIISDNCIKQTVMKDIEEAQHNNGSRKSTREKPLLFIVYLPTNTRNNTISLLQRTLKKFLEEHNMWKKYNIEFSNSVEDTGCVNEDYNDFIKTIMNNTRTKNKLGCILFLGNKGSVGVTYHDCDVTISLDDGHNLDNQKQRFSRALTEAEGKTVGINVDMNIQRTYMHMMSVLQRHRKITKTKKTNAEIMHYLFEHKMFLFNPHEFNHGKMRTCEIISYFQKEADKIVEQIDDTPFLEELVCDDNMREFIKTDFKRLSQQSTDDQIINKDLEGEQPDCPKGENTKVLIEITTKNENNDVVEKNKEEVEKVELLINQTYEMCKSFLFPLLSLISRSYKVFCFKEIFTNEKTCDLILSLLKNKKIEINDNNYVVIVNIMNNIIDNNEEIVNNIREIYSVAPAHKLRALIAKHFIPTADEKKKNAEVPTPVALVDEMLDKIPTDFWRTPHKVFEPCCGKGNFVLGIFDRFYEGLSELIVDEIERCRVIVTECIYYADLTALNVFVTTELLKCHIQSYCGLYEVTEEEGFMFNGHVGDTLKLDVVEKWGVEGFDAVVGNPPYQEKVGVKKTQPLWNLFAKKFIDVLSPDGYLLFVHPSGWRSPCGSFKDVYEKIMNKNLIYINMNDFKKGAEVFGVGTNFDYYLLQNNENQQLVIVDDIHNKKHKIDLKKWSFIPSGGFEIYEKILSLDNEEKTKVIYSRSMYGTDKENMKIEKTETYTHPCCYTITLRDGMKCFYSSTKKEHFDIPKVIWSNGLGTYPVVDENGCYGLTQFSYAIVDKKENLNNIKKSMENPNFIKLMEFVKFTNNKYNYKVISLFKKDFWKEFM